MATNLSSLHILFIVLLVLSPHLNSKSNEWSLFCHGFHHVARNFNSMNVCRRNKSSNSHVIRSAYGYRLFTPSSSTLVGGIRNSAPAASTSTSIRTCRIKRRDDQITLYNSKRNNQEEETGGNSKIDKNTDSNSQEVKNETEDNNGNDKNSKSNVNEDGTQDDNLVTYEELMRDPELFRMEYMKSRERKNNLFLLDNIGKAFYVLVYTFVISSIVLKGFGYGFVVDSSSSTNGYNDATGSGFRVGASNIKVVTLENKAFMLEMQGKDDQAAKIRRNLRGYNDNNYGNSEKID